MLSLPHEISQGLLTWDHIALVVILSLGNFFIVNFFVGHSSQVLSKSLYDMFGKMRDNGTSLIEYLFIH
jgi:ABC-type spermidine/putrescine transport system permease subunit I